MANGKKNIYYEEDGTRVCETTYPCGDFGEGEVVYRKKYRNGNLISDTKTYYTFGEKGLSYFKRNGEWYLDEY